MASLGSYGQREMQNKRQKVEFSLIAAVTECCQPAGANPSNQAVGTSRSPGIPNHWRRGAAPNTPEVNGNCYQAHHLTEQQFC